MQPRILEIVGPTASGKKLFATDAAVRFGGEIVSADSRKVYRGLDIGTAKPSTDIRARIPHHCIDIIDPDVTFNAADWVAYAREAVEGVLDRGRLPILSGGTGFYLRAFREGLSAGVEPDPALRAELERIRDERGSDALHRLLADTDPVRAAEVHPNDVVRIMRALEIVRTTGRPYAELAAAARIGGGDYDWCTVGIVLPREDLYRSVDTRVDAMLDAGLVAEARGLIERYGPEAPGMATVGYAEWVPYVEGEMDYADCVEALKRNTRRYAKRQMTWFRARPEVRWVDVRDGVAREALLDAVGAWLAGGELPAGSEMP